MIWHVCRKPHNIGCTVHKWADNPAADNKFEHDMSQPLCAELELAVSWICGVVRLRAQAWIVLKGDTEVSWKRGKSKSVNEPACLWAAPYCIHVAVKNTEPFIPKVHTHTVREGELRTNLSLERSWLEWGMEGAMEVVEAGLLEVWGGGWMAGGGVAVRVGQRATPTLRLPAPNF